MESRPTLRTAGPSNAGDFVEVIDALNKRYGAVGRIAYFVGDNVYVTFGRRRWSPKYMFFPEQLHPARVPQAVQGTVRTSRLLHGAARLLRQFHSH